MVFPDKLPKFDVEKDEGVNNMCFPVDVWTNWAKAVWTASLSVDFRTLDKFMLAPGDWLADAWETWIPGIEDNVLEMKELKCYTSPKLQR